MSKDKQKRVPMSELTKEKIRLAKLGKPRKENKETISLPEVEVNFKDVKQGDLITGFGDVISKVTKFFGIEPCGECIKRRDEINSWSIMQTFYIPTYDEIELIRTVRDNKILKQEDKDVFFNVYNLTFNKKIKVCNCPGVVLSMVQNFDKHFNLNYEI